MKEGSGAPVALLQKYGGQESTKLDSACNDVLAFVWVRDLYEDLGLVELTPPL